LLQAQFTALRAELSQGATGFFNAAVAEALAEFQGGGEALAGQLALAEAQVGESAEV